MIGFSINRQKVNRLNILQSTSHFARLFMRDWLSLAKLLEVPYCVSARFFNSFGFSDLAILQIGPFTKKTQKLANLKFNTTCRPTVFNSFRVIQIYLLNNDERHSMR